MLVMEKKKDISILKAMGAESAQIKKIFIAEGVFQALIGAILGLFLGIVICLLQKQFGFIKLGGSGTFVVDAYPVDIHLWDVFLVFLIIFSIASLASIERMAMRRSSILRRKSQI